MKTDANWCMRVWTLSLILIVAVAALSCGGNGTGVNLGSNGNGVSAVTDDTTKATDLIPATPESEINTLPAYQRELLSDPGWNQPYIAPREGTAVEAPTFASLNEATERAMAAGVELNPRFTQGAGKGASWYGDAGPFTVAITKGEYATLAPGANPPYGCNKTGGNTSPAGHAIEDLIAATASTSSLPPYALNYVREGLCSTNYFNTLAGATKNASAAVYQAYCSLNDGSFDPKVAAGAQVAEISYRSSLVPAGNPGTVCGATAYVVRNNIWRSFNSELKVGTIPNGPVAVYDILIAPSGPENVGGQSPSKTTGVYQPFYFGNMSGCFGGAWIIGLTASSSSCVKFADYFKPGATDPMFWYKPVYGVLLQRWLDMAPTVNQPWTGEMGWPVFGPVGYANGTLQLNSKGAYYQWGMWFERGFIWWVDYDQVTSPTVPDEAQVYSFAGSNVYCQDEDKVLVPTSPKVFYGAAGPLGVSVTVDAMRKDATATWAPVPQDSLGSEYQVALPSKDGLATVELKMHAQGYGGTPNAQCKYKTYVWAFRDGQVQSASGGDYNPAHKTAVHTYGSASTNLESTYVVRVQVQDEVGFAYGDSLPIVLGHGGSGGGGEIMLIRDDAPTFDIYNTNFDALCADLDEISAKYTVVEYTPTVHTDFVTQGFKVAIWYRGGPGAVGEPTMVTPWTAAEETSFNALLQKKMFLISQSHQSESACNYAGYYWGWDNYSGSQMAEWIPGAMWTHATDQNTGLLSDEFWFQVGDYAQPYASEMGKGRAATRGPQTLTLPGMWGQDAAERNLLTGSSGKLPSRMQWATGGTDVLQFVGRAWYPLFPAARRNPGYTCGMAANSDGSGGGTDANYGMAQLSNGNTSSGGTSWILPGPGRYWYWGFPYAKLTVTNSSPAGMTRAEIVQNVLSWLDGTLTFGAAGGGAAGGYSPYDSVAEIISVKPGYWTTSPPGYVQGALCQPGTNYPDSTGTDVYKTNYTNGAGERYVSTTLANNNGMNAGDIDFQFPWYAYITTTNGVVETSADTTVVPPSLTTDDTIVIKGLLVNDSDLNWTRYTPPAGQLPNALLNLAAPCPSVAGYFTSTTGNTGDETYATYGTGVPALVWDNAYKLEVEAIAHWPLALAYGSNPATLKWSMFPGHRMFMPGTGTYCTDSAVGWDAFRQLFDIDPTAAPAGRGTSSWNAANVDYTSAIGQGRVVSFNYHSVNGWNGDLNRNGTLDLNDKFPIRCRLFTDYANYIDSDPATAGVQPYLWPNNQPANTTYLEAGCYVVDNGQPVYRVRITTNGDPVVTGSTGAYTVAVPFNLRFGTAPYTVTVDADYNGTWGSAPNGRVFPVTGFDNTTNGSKTGSVAISTMADGDYSFAIRVVDGVGDVSTAVYPDPVALFPSEVFKETFEGGSQTVTNADETWTLSGSQGSMGYDWENRSAPAPYYGFTAHTGSRYVRWNTTDTYLGSNVLRYATTGPHVVSPNTFYKIEFWMNGHTSEYWSLSNPMNGLAVQYSFNNSTWNDIPSTYYLWDNGLTSLHIYTQAELGSGTWTYKVKPLTTGPSDTQIWFRYGMACTSYAYADPPYGTDHNGGPAIDDIKMWPPTPPPPPIWSEDFESNSMTTNWNLVSTSGVNMQTASGNQGSGGPSAAQGGTYYCVTTPRPYPYAGGSVFYSKSTPITIAANTTYNLGFYTAGDTEDGWDMLQVGYSFNNSTWTWVVQDNSYMGWPGISASLGGTGWSSWSFPVASGAGQTQVWIRIAFQADGSGNGIGPCLDTMTFGLP